MSRLRDWVSDLATRFIGFEGSGDAIGDEGTSAPVVSIERLATHFFTEEGVVRAVDDVSFTVGRGKTFALVGESGCGKSVTALSILRLVSAPGRIVGGRVIFHDNGRAIVLSELAEAELRRIRGAKISMIFQEPMTSLNPVFTIGAQIAEAVRLHQATTRRAARQRALELLDNVRIPEPGRRIDEYPHQFSGGMRQRAMIAMALACSPQLLIADEPTTALDVTIQAQILDLLRELQQQLEMAVLLITHDLGVVAETADDVAVMYASKIVERGPVARVFAEPLHPYTQGLLASRPRAGAAKGQKLAAVAGMVPSPLRFPGGCKFHPRCPFATDECRQLEPDLVAYAPRHQVRCHLAGRVQWQSGPPRAGVAHG